MHTVNEELPVGKVMAACYQQYAYPVVITRCGTHEVAALAWSPSGPVGPYQRYNKHTRYGIGFSGYLRELAQGETPETLVERYDAAQRADADAEAAAASRQRTERAAAVFAWWRATGLAMYSASVGVAHDRDYDAYVISVPTPGGGRRNLLVHEQHTVTSDGYPRVTLHAAGVTIAVTPDGKTHHARCLPCSPVSGENIADVLYDLLH
jgi:hypothetical protein